MRAAYHFAKSLLLSSVTFSFSVQANVINLKLMDQHQQPISQAVIEVLNSAEKTSNPDEVAIIDQVDKMFSPEQIIIQQGQAVDFPNSDNIRHHVYSFSSPKTFELKLYADKPEEPVLFDKPGIVVVGCNIHDSMIGYIYIAQHEKVVISSEQGLAKIETELAEPEISIWHRHTTGGAENRQTFKVEDLQQNETGEYVISLELAPPPPRDSFEDTFGATSHH